MPKYFKYILLLSLLLFTFVPRPSYATHIIGGELIYRCIKAFGDTLGMYQLMVKLYRHCDTLTIHAPYDSVIYVAIYDEAGVQKWNFEMALRPPDTLENNTYNLCLFAPPTLCVEEAVYWETFNIPAGKYYMTYQRCCRNNRIVNVVNPLETGAGWYLDITPPSQAVCNSSPYFKEYPPTIICVGEDFTYDHSAIDDDGDSLVYSLCPASGFYNQQYDPAPNPPWPPDMLFDVQYVSGYNYLHPLGPNDSMFINPQTGLMTLYPGIIGQFVVAVCVSEYRDSVLLSTNKRDFQFNVAECIEDVSAGFSYSFTDCDVRKVKFNTYSSYHASFYWWDFGDPFEIDDTSILETPEYRYPQYGQNYTVTQIVNKGYECADTIEKVISIPTRLRAKFTAENVCAFDTTYFYDKSYTNQYYGNIIVREWNFNDGNLSYKTNPKYVYTDTLEHVVKLTITTDKYCQDDVTDTLKPYTIPIIYAGEDVYIIPGDSAQLFAGGGYTYSWSPGMFLNDSTLPNPSATPPQTTLFTVTGTSVHNCRSRDTVKVNVIDAAIAIPNAFTPNDDGANDILYLLPIGIKELIEFKMFNRWGEVIFETNDIVQGWDGNYKGEPQEIGTYVYYYKAETLPGKIIVDYGNVSLLR